METSFFLFSPLESKEDIFKENVNLLIQNLTGSNIDLDKYTEISVEQVKTMITNSNIIENNRIKNADNDYQKIIYTGVQGVYNLKIEQYYWVIDNKAYVLSLTCEQNKFDDYKNVGEDILNSFLFEK